MIYPSETGTHFFFDELPDRLVKALYLRDRKAVSGLKEIIYLFDWQDVLLTGQRREIKERLSSGSRK